MRGCSWNAAPGPGYRIFWTSGVGARLENDVAVGETPRGDQGCFHDDFVFGVCAVGEAGAESRVSAYVTRTARDRHQTREP